MPDAIIQILRTEVYFLFPEYIDDHQSASFPYIHHMAFGFDGEQPAFWGDVTDMLSLFKYENGVDKYYDKRNLDGMLYPYRVMDYPSVDTGIRTSLRDFDVIDWREVFGCHGETIDWRGFYIMDDTCAMVYTRSHTDTPAELIHAALYVVENAIENDGDVFVFKKENTICSLPLLRSVKELHAWFSEYRIPLRQFKYCRKHGANGQGGWSLPDGSHTALLDCSCNHAQEVLYKAVGDPSVSQDLWYYDAEYNKVLYFEYQNKSPQNEYHGYHLGFGEKGIEKVNFELLRQIQDDIPDNVLP